MMKKDIRLKQRLENFVATLKLMEEAVNIKKPSEVEKGGLVKYFELSFELVWKLLQDRLKMDGFDYASPKAVIRQSAKSGYVDDGRLFLDMLESRNKATHVYSGKDVSELGKEIKKRYLAALKNIEKTLLEL